jgi:hypothetical protein
LGLPCEKPGHPLFQFICFGYYLIMAQFDNMNEQEQMQMLMSQLQDSNLRQSVMQYINQTANGLDKDANSKVLIETLARESVHNQKSTAMWKSRTKKSVAVGVVAVVLAITVQFLVNYFTNELSKESHVDEQGAMVSTDGKVVKTQLEEMKVGADGKLVSRSGGDDAVKTMPSLAKVPLASSLPDATLMALEEITVHSEKGYTLQIKVHGFSRVPVLNSRCGNVVHFYTAWKGRVTLDSTDLLLDEATAAEFKDAGFSLTATGRRLAGQISVDAFAKALDGLKKGGKWTCADVPLPSSSLLGGREQTVYTYCGTKGELASQCYSNYGGLKIGVTALEESVAANVAGALTTDPLKKGKQKLFMKNHLAVMKSEMYSMSVTEYVMHPGQQLVDISDVASGNRVVFQMNTDKTRSHCVVSREPKVAVVTDDKIDTDFHFEYLGINEENGRVLRHFRLALGADYARAMYGESADATQVYMNFWDVAETMQPYRLVSSLTVDSVIVFESSKIVSDLDVLAAAQNRTGQNVSDLMKCSEAERETKNSGRPEMLLWQDLSPDQADYYSAENPREISALLEKYLDTTRNPFAMPDLCYEVCRTEVHSVLSKLAEGTGICEADGLKQAIKCIDNIGENSCRSSRFSTHVGVGKCELESDNDTNTRVLEMSEDEDDVELSENALEDGKMLVNQTRSLAFKALAGLTGAALGKAVISAGKQMKSMMIKLAKATGKGHAKITKEAQKFAKKNGLYAFNDEFGKQIKAVKLVGGGAITSQWLQPGMLCLSKRLVPTPGIYYRLGCGEALGGKCEAKELAKTNKDGTPNTDYVEGAVISQRYPAVCMKVEVPDYKGNSFSFEVGWVEKDKTGKIDPKFPVMWIEAMGCVNVLDAAFKVPYPAYVSVCAGGLVEILFKETCPGMGKINVYGKVFKRGDAGLDLWLFKIRAFRYEVGIAAGMSWRAIQTKCWWKWNNGWGRRRWWTLRRRDIKVCDFWWTCDFYIEGYRLIEFCIWQFRIALRYWVKDWTVDLTLTFYSWSWWNKNWIIDYDFRPFRYWFSDWR